MHGSLGGSINAHSQSDSGVDATLARPQHVGSAYTGVITLRESAKWHFQAPQHRVVLQVQNNSERQRRTDYTTARDHKMDCSFLVRLPLRGKHPSTTANEPTGLFG